MSVKRRVLPGPNVTCTSNVKKSNAFYPRRLFSCSVQHLYGGQCEFLTLWKLSVTISNSFISSPIKSGLFNVFRLLMMMMVWGVITPPTTGAAVSALKKTSTQPLTAPPNIIVKNDVCKFWVPSIPQVAGEWKMRKHYLKMVWRQNRLLWRRREMKQLEQNTKKIPHSLKIIFLHCSVETPSFKSTEVFSQYVFKYQGYLTNFRTQLLVAPPLMPAALMAWQAWARGKWEKRFTLLILRVLFKLQPRGEVSAWQHQQRHFFVTCGSSKITVKTFIFPK